MPKIDINLTIKSKATMPKAQAEQPDIVWPTMLPSDDPFIAVTQFDFFDGWTVPLDLNLTSASPLAVSGQYINNFLFGDAISLFYMDDDGNEQQTDGTVSSDATYDGSQTLIQVSISTENPPFKIRTWIDCPDLSGSLVEVDSSTAAFDGASSIAPIEVDIVCFSQTDSKVPIETIEREYGTEGNARWERKPLGAIDSAAMNASKVWVLGESGFYNILLELKKELDDEDARRGDATSITENEEDFKSKNSSETLTYIAKKRPPPGSAIAVSECGSGSVGHYVQDLQRPTGEYDTMGEPLYVSVGPAHAEDRVVFQDSIDGGYEGDDDTPDARASGIFFMGFDTANTTDYKVTSGPTFDSEEVDGYFVKAGKKYQIYMMARRAAYFCRTRKQTGLPIKSYFADADYYHWSEQVPIYDFWWRIVGYNTVYHTDWPDICSSALSSILFQDGYYYRGDSGALNFQETHGISNFDVAILDPLNQIPPEQTYLTAPWFYGCSGIVTGIRSEIYVGLWWDRFPHNFRIGNGGGFSPITPLYLPYYPILEPGSTHQIHFSGEAAGMITTDTSLENVKEYYENALSGKNNLNFIQGNWPIKWFQGYGGSNSIQLPYSVCCNSPSLKLNFSAEETYDPLKRIWNKIAGAIEDPSDENDWIPKIGSSIFWQENGIWTFNTASNPYSMWDNIPYGMGISPSKTGELCGIIRDKNTDESWFVWRKTDETLDLKVTSIKGGYKGAISSFESSQSGKPLESNPESFAIHGRDWNEEPIPGDVDHGQCLGSDGWGYVDQFTGTKTRLKTHMGRRPLDEKSINTLYPEMLHWETGALIHPACMAAWAFPINRFGYGEDGPCGHVLDVPFALLFSKERALHNRNYPETFPDDRRLPSTYDIINRVHFPGICGEEGSSYADPKRRNKEPNAGGAGGYY